MQSHVPRATLFVLSSVFAVCGCGQAKHPDRQPVILSKPPSAPAPQANTKDAASKDAVSKTNAKSKQDRGDRKSVAPADADPKTVFLVSQVGEPMTVEREVAVLPSERFEVAAADIAVNSTRFVVGAIQPSTLAPPLIGTNQAKGTESLPKGFKPIKEVGYSTEGLPLRIECEKTGTILALVPAGTAIVGSNDGPDDSKPTFKVRLDAFYMEIVETTVENYEKFRAEMGKKKKLPPAPSNVDGLPLAPVLGVTWGQAQLYARWAGMELPSEAEFEKAGRGPSGLRTPWGDGKPLWSNREISTVGAYPADSSPYGILDLAGGAKEWCADIYSPKGHKEASDASSMDNFQNWRGPKPTKTTNQRVIKGNGPDWSMWYREGRDVAKGQPDVGFRCVLRLENKESKQEK